MGDTQFFTDLVRRNLTGNTQHRLARCNSSRHSRHRIKHTRAGNSREHAGSSRRLGITHGHESGPLFMTGMHGPNPVPASMKCIKQRIELDTRNTKHRIYTVCE